MASFPVFPWFPVWKFVLHTGFRSGEAYALKRRDLDREEKRIMLDTKYNFDSRVEEQLKESDIERYQEHLKAQGLKTNTRRRKLLTLGRFLKFTAGRNKRLSSLHRNVPAPGKVERIPATLSR